MKAILLVYGFGFLILAIWFFAEIIVKLNRIENKIDKLPQVTEQQED